MIEKLPPIVGLLLLAGGAIAVRRELRHLSLQQIRDGLAAIPPASLAAAAACTLLSYFILSFYDRLAVAHVGRRLSFGRTAFAAFCSYVLSHNLGFAAISGAAVRFRLYGNWGFGPVEITRVIAFCSATYGLGACALAAGVLLGEPHALGPLAVHLSPFFLRGMGLGFAAIVLCYVALSFRLRQVRCWRITVPLPGPAMACAQVVVAAAEVAATAAIAYVLLPPGLGLGFPAFLALYITCYSAGLLASVPGGLGVFDGAMVLGLSPFLHAADAIVVILVFRLFYYVVPLFVAGLLFAGHELILRGDVAWTRRHDPVAPLPHRPSGVVRESEADFSVTVAAAVTVLCGLLLLALHLVQRPSAIAFVLPPPAAPFGSTSGSGVLDGLLRFAQATADYLPSLIGSLLFGLAIGLSQRVTLAWRATLVLLAAGAALTALTGAPAFVPCMLVLSALVIAPFRSSYYRHARVLSEPLTPTTILPMLILLGCIVMLGLSGPEEEGAGAPAGWWGALLPGAPDGRAEASLILALLVGLVAIARLILPGRISFSPWNEDARIRYDAMVVPSATPPALPQPDGLLFGESGRAAIPFRRQGRFLIGYGDPIGSASDQVSVIWRFRDLALQEGRAPVFWRVDAALLETYADIGLQAWPLDNKRAFLCCAAERGPGVKRLLFRDEARVRAAAATGASR